MNENKDSLVPRNSDDLKNTVKNNKNNDENLDSRNSGHLENTVKNDKNNEENNVGYNSPLRFTSNKIDIKNFNMSLFSI